MAKKKTSQKNLTTAQSIWIAVAILAAFVAIVPLCVLFTRPGPLGALQKAGSNTIFAENFTAVYELDVNGKKMDGHINAAIDPTEKKLDVFLQFSSDIYDYEGGIHNGTFVIVNAKNDFIQTVDIQNRVDSFFTLLESGKPDWSVLLDFSETNLKEAISADFDFEIFMSCLGEWLNKLNNTRWAEKNAGFTKTKTDGVVTYSYNPDPYTFVQKTVPMFKKAFREKTRYDDLNAYIDNARFLFSEGKASFSFDIKETQLIGSQFQLKFLNLDVSGNVSFIGIGSTIVDIDQVAFYIEEASK